MARVLSIGLCVLALSNGAAAQINTDKVLLDHNKKIKQLLKKNRQLCGQIEQLQEQQQQSSKKIGELFNLMEYKKSSAVVEQTMLRVREHNRKARKLYTDARSLLVTDQYEQAINLFNKYLEIYPDNNHAADTQYWLAKTYLAKGDYQSAKQAFIGFQQEHSLHHKYANSLFELARVYVELKQTSEATKLLNTMVSKFPEHNVAIRAQRLLSEIQPSNPAPSTAPSQAQ